MEKKFLLVPGEFGQCSWATLNYNGDPSLAYCAKYDKIMDENWKLAEYEKENMRGIADEAGSESQNNNDTMKTLSNEADEIKENNPNNANESLKNTADQENLPTTGQSNTQGNEQTQNEDNSMNVQ